MQHRSAAAAVAGPDFAARHWLQAGGQTQCAGASRGPRAMLRMLAARFMDQISYLGTAVCMRSCCSWMKWTLQP